ncbi:hypothetical protein CYY_005080 [Polysphondylium violaceum]|uniref:Uncharacterized protein n=1 Tax=Polysphondylium violaceum TaxID=133409 RepID=A0A8J4PSC8_9MYCE|nr:hypothetical protein CYY_005080 [Polysphondylium violaceum]
MNYQPATTSINYKKVGYFKQRRGDIKNNSIATVCCIDTKSSLNNYYNNNNNKSSIRVLRHYTYSKRNNNTKPNNLLILLSKRKRVVLHKKIIKKNQQKKTNTPIAISQQALNFNTATVPNTTAEMKPESLNSPYNSPMFSKDISRDFNSTCPGYAPFNSTEYLTQNYYDILHLEDPQHFATAAVDQQLNNYGSMFDLIKDGNNNSLFPAQIVPSL